MKEQNICCLCGAENCNDREYNPLKINTDFGDAHEVYSGEHSIDQNNVCTSCKKRIQAKIIKAIEDYTSSFPVMAHKEDKLKTTTFMLKESELEHINELSHATKISNSVLIRASIKGFLNIGNDEKIKKALTTLNGYKKNT